MEAYFDASDDSPEHTAIVNYELPLSILSMLGVKLSDYAIRANASYLALILILRKDLETQQRVSDFGSVLLQAERI